MSNATYDPAHLARAAEQFFCDDFAGNATTPLAVAELLIHFGKETPDQVLYDVGGVDLAEENAGRRAGHLSKLLCERAHTIAATDPQHNERGSWQPIKRPSIAILADWLPPTATLPARLRLKWDHSQCVRVVKIGKAEDVTREILGADSLTGSRSLLNTIGACAIALVSRESPASLAALRERRFDVHGVGHHSRPSGTIHHYVVWLS